MKFLVVLSLFLISQDGKAFETLNYDCAHRELPDITSALNAETNRRIQKVISATPNCEIKQLLNALRAEIADPWLDNLETWVDRSPLVKCTVPASHSVYQDFTVLDSPIGLAAGLKGVVNIGGIYLGTDKLSHFMTEGYEYYIDARRGSNLNALLLRGLREENGIYGMQTTGIRSYADMSANFRGFLFWRNLFEGADPHLKCVANQWQLQREFDWREYVDSSFDESINCNDYKTKAMQEKVDQRSTVLREQVGASQLTCPYRIDECEKFAKNFSATELSFLVSKRCLNAAAKN